MKYKTFADDCLARCFILILLSHILFVYVYVGTLAS